MCAANYPATRLPSPIHVFDETVSLIVFARNSEVIRRLTLMYVSGVWLMGRRAGGEEYLAGLQ